MNFINKIVIILISCITLVFGGCSQVEIGINILPSGQIQQYVVIALNENELENVGIDFTTFLDEVGSIVSDYISSKFSGVPATLTKNETLGTITGILTYPSYQFYYDYWTSRGEVFNDDEPEINEGFLWDTTIVSRFNLCYQTEEMENLYAEITTRLEETIDTTLPFTLDDVDIYYSYAVPYTTARVSRLKANCTYSYDYTYDDGSYTLRHFVWKINSSDTDFEAILYSRSIHNSVWYALLLILTGIFAFILFINNYFKNKKKQKLNLNISHSLDKTNLDLNSHLTTLISNGAEQLTINSNQSIIPPMEIKQSLKKRDYDSILPQENNDNKKDNYNSASPQESNDNKNKDI